MEQPPSPTETNRWPTALLAAAWLALIVVAYFRVPIDAPPGPRFNLWVYVPDLVDPPARPAAAGHAGWSYLPQRFDLLATAAAILVAAWFTGRLILRIVPLPRGALAIERAAFAFGIGLAALSLATLAAGLAGTLSRPLLAGLMTAAVCTEAALNVAARRRPAPHTVNRDQPPRDPPQCRALSKTAVGWFAACLPFVVAMLLGSLLPSTDFDVNEYHFEGPKEFFQAGRITFLAHNVYTSFPFGTEMLTLLAMVLRDDWYRGALAGKCVLMALAPLTALALFAAGRRAFCVASGRFAALLYLASPWTYRISTIAYAEGGVCFYLSATLLAVLVAADAADDKTRPAWRSALLPGLLAGAALACKYPALVSVVAPLGIAVGALACRCRTAHIPAATATLLDTPRDRPNVRLLASSGWGFALGVLLAVGPWLVKNTIETGNPVYPLAYRLLGGRDWNAALEARWQRAHSPSTYAPSSLAALAADVAYRSFWVSPLLFGLAPLALVRRAPRRRAVWLAAYVGWLFISCWLFTHRLDRFWVPLLPVAALLAGGGAAWWWTAFRGRWARGAFVLAGAPLLLFQFELMTGVGAWCGYNDYLRDLDEAGQVAAFVTAPEIVHLNEQLPSGAKVLAVGDAEMFFARFPVVYNTVFDRSIFEDWCSARPGDPAAPLRDPAAIRATLAANGITHVYVNWLEVLRYRSPGNYGYSAFVAPERFAELQRAGLLAPPWSIPQAVMELDHLDPPRRAELQTWGRALIIGDKQTPSFITFQVFPVTQPPAH